MVDSTMQDAPLLISSILEHGRRVYGDSQVITFEGETHRTASYREVGDRAVRLASALQSLGVVEGDRVGTFMWNTQEHLEAYLAIPSMGAVLHTLNLRLFPEQLAYIAKHAGDKVVLVDATILPLLAKVAHQLTTVERYVLVGAGSLDEAASLLGKPVDGYEDLLGASPPVTAWPVVDERSAAAMCYTSGTTGNPKGVVYSHRSTYLHSLAVGTANVFGVGQDDCVLPIVPMFHANAWGLPYAAWMAGADVVMPGRFLQAEPVATMIETFRPTIAGAVPTIWNDLLAYVDKHPTDLSSLRLVPCGGSAVPLSLMKAFQERHGVRIIQAWGMTETSPLAAVAHPVRGAEDEWEWRAHTGRITFGVETRIMGEEGEQPWDGESVGEIQVRGPWITGSYHLDPDPAKFDDGWLRTGDVASLDPRGFLQITDRAKDVIKSGGEWISSVELENTLMGHGAVREAAVVAVPDAKWDERPLACVVVDDGATVTPEELRDYLADKVATWWLPERWSFIAEVPKTSVGKFDKKVLRKQYADGELTVTEL